MILIDFGRGKNNGNFGKRRKSLSLEIVKINSAANCKLY